MINRGMAGRERRGRVDGGRGRRWSSGTVVAVAAALALAPLPPSLVERWYGMTVYPVIARALAYVSGVVPVACLDLLLLGTLAWLGLLVRDAARAPRGGRAAAWGGAVGRLVVAAASLYLVFLACWGLNYRREPLAARLVQADTAPSTEAVVALGRTAVARLNALHDAAHAQGWPDAGVDDAALRASAADVRAWLDIPAAPATRLKPTLLRWLFRWEGVDAMTNPFGLDLLRNPDLLPWERPFVAAHEWAHQAGFAVEAEANYLGWLTCIRGDARSQYSGWLFLYWQIAGELPRDAWRDLDGALAAGVRQDRNAIAARLRAGLVPALQQAGWAAYDGYLRANGVPEGVASYGEVLTLILRSEFDAAWRPARRPVGGAGR